MPKSYLTEADREGLSENAIYAVESGAAEDAGDTEAAWEWLAKAEIPAFGLLAMKRRHGADWIRAKGFRTETAEREYGKDWLDREI